MLILRNLLKPIMNGSPLAQGFGIDGFFQVRNYIFNNCLHKSLNKQFNIQSSCIAKVLNFSEYDMYTSQEPKA